VNPGMEVLMWISSSEWPLKAIELCHHALAEEVGTRDLNTHHIPSTRTLLSCTLGLVTIDEQSIVPLMHFTLQEYPTANLHLFITSHSMMAEICLTYLNFRSACELAMTLCTILSAVPFFTTPYVVKNWSIFLMLHSSLPTP